MVGRWQREGKPEMAARRVAVVLKVKDRVLQVFKESEGALGW